jgi:hypothetical protein
MASITSLAATDTWPTSRGIINSNFTNINNELTTASSDIDAAQADITALETDKLDRNNQLRTGNGAWKVSYTNASGNETELALWAADTFLKSNGATSAPSFWNQSVDINGTTEDTTGDMDADFALVYDNSAGANRKQKVNVFRASDAEALARSSSTKFITPSQVDKFWVSSTTNNDYYTYQIPILLNGTDSVLPGWTSTTVEATSPGGAGWFTQLRGSASSTFVIQDLLPWFWTIGTAAMYWNPWANKETRLKFRMWFNTTTNMKWFGICRTAANIYTAQTDISIWTIRFIINGTSIYAHNANWSAATTTDISSGITITAWNVYEIVYYSTTLCEFYINGVLKATHTTNLPTTTAEAHYLAIGNDTGNNYFTLCPPVVSIKI